MLILSRRSGESFFIGEDIEITIADVSGDKAKIVINAPKEIAILRSELKEIKDSNLEAAALPATSADQIRALFKKE